MLIQCIVAGEGYQPLVGLQDIRNLKHLTEDAVRDILRSTYRDSELKIVNMGQLTDMSGTNDAFNSSICSLEVSLRCDLCDYSDSYGHINIEDPSNCVPLGDRQPECQGRAGGPGHQWGRRRQRGAGAEPEDIPLRHQISSQSFLHQSNAQVDKTLSQ